VTKELAEALPALEGAKASVNGIKKDDLNQIKSFAKPPPLVTLTMEAVCCVIQCSSKSPDWAAVRSVIGNMNFIKSVLEFKTDDLPAAVKAFVMKNYIQKPEWDVEKIGFSSKAAGPLAMWVSSQLKYADILQKVDPLRKEVSDLKAEGEQIFKLKREYDDAVQKAEQSINQLQ
jgi:dynein heavy chain 1, cytosolic